MSIVIVDKSKKPKSEKIDFVLEDQIKNMLAMAGDVFQSVKVFKAAYAVLQSIDSKKFSVAWDVLFFSLYSSKLHSELSSLIVKWGEVEEVTWRHEGLDKKKSIEPFHHIYILPEKSQRTIEDRFYENFGEKFYADFIVWSLLKPQFAVHWMYLLELYTYYKLPQEDQKRLENKSATWPLPNLKLKTLCKNLSLELEKDKKEPLKIEIDNLTAEKNEENNLYLFLPFEMDDEKRGRFVQFYIEGEHNEYVKFEESGKPNILKMRLDPDGISKVYDYLDFKKTVPQIIGKEHDRFNVGLAGFDKLMEEYTAELYKDLPEPNEENFYAYYSVKNAAKRKQEFLTAIPDKLKLQVIKRAQFYLSALERYYELAKWRHTHIMENLVDLAKITQVEPIDLFFDQVDVGGYLNASPVNKQTMVGLEFSDEFRRLYREKFGYPLPSGQLHHVYHFVQPAEVLKAIHNNNEKCLLNNGPVIGEYGYGKR